MATTDPTVGSNPSQEERLLQLAISQVRHDWGIQAAKMLGPQLYRAVILAEITRIIGAQDDSANVWVKLAVHAVKGTSGWVAP